MKAKLETALTLTLVACALAVTGLLLKREFLKESDSSTHADQKPAYNPSWRSEIAKGIRMGSIEAPVQLLEFADFECPFCGSFHRNLKDIQRKYPAQIAVTYFHFPIPGHRFALPAARVAECAGEQGRFEAMHDQLFDGQDQFGLKPWHEYATAAGVPDIPAFDACTKKSDPIPRVEEGKELGAKLDVQGTPTIIINGWKLGHPPNAEELNGMVKKILANRSPVTSDGKFAQ